MTEQNESIVATETLEHIIDAAGVYHMDHQSDDVLGAALNDARECVSYDGQVNGGELETVAMLTIDPSDESAQYLLSMLMSEGFRLVAGGFHADGQVQFGVEK